MDNSIKVLCISTNGIILDGITCWLKSTFSSMNLDGFKVVTTAFEDSSSSLCDSVRSCGVDVVTVPNRKKHPIRYMKAFRRLLHEGHFDIVHVCCNSAMATFELVEARRQRIEMRIAHSHNTSCEHRIMNSLLDPLFQASITDRFACGKDAGSWLFGDRPFIVIPNGKLLEAYSYSSKVRESVRKELGLSSNNVAYGHVGAFNEQKNHEKLLDVFFELHRRNPAARLLLIGEGELQSRIQRKASTMGIADAVVFLGRRDDVPRLLNAMDCMIFPSLFEGLPNVVLEWQLNGLPLIMSDTITDECIMTGLVSRVSLELSSAKWADKAEHVMSIGDRSVDSSSAINAARTAGYDIRDSSALLRRLYLGGVERCG